MTHEDEAFMKSIIDRDMERFSQRTPLLERDFGYLQNILMINVQNQIIADLGQRLDKANATIRNANKRIEELKASNTEITSNPDFATLGLDPKTAFLDLTEEQIQLVLQSAHKVRAKLHHPDNGGETPAMKAVNIAYDRLKDIKTRGNYTR